MIVLCGISGSMVGRGEALETGEVVFARLSLRGGARDSASSLIRDRFRERPAFLSSSPSGPITALSGLPTPTAPVPSPLAIAVEIGMRP